jgi:hypothetical protein
MKIKYTSSVKVAAGWRSVAIVAACEQVSPGMVQVTRIELIDGETPGYGQSRTGAKRQEFNGKWLAEKQVGAKKRLSACEVMS